MEEKFARKIDAWRAYLENYLYKNPSLREMGRMVEYERARKEAV